MNHILLARNPTQRQPGVGICQQSSSMNLRSFLTAIEPPKESEFNAAMIPLQFGRQAADAKVECKLSLETSHPITTFKALPTPPLTPPPTNSNGKTPSDHSSCDVVEHYSPNNPHDTDQNTTIALMNLVKDMYPDIKDLTRKNKVLMRGAMRALDVTFDVKAIKEENQRLTEERADLRTLIEDLKASNATLSKDNALLQTTSNIASILAYELAIEKKKNACSEETLDPVPETPASEVIGEVTNKAVKFSLPKQSDYSKNTVLNTSNSSDSLQDCTKTVTEVKDVPYGYQWHLERIERPREPTITVQGVTPRKSLPFSKHGSIRSSIKKKFRSSIGSIASID